MEYFLIYTNKEKMKKEGSNGNENRWAESISVTEQYSIDSPAKRNFFLDGIAKIIYAMKPKRFLSYRKKKINRDGSSVETEFIYRDDR